MTATAEDLECPKCGKHTSKTPWNATAVWDKNNNWSHDEISCPFCGFKIKTEV